MESIENEKHIYVLWHGTNCTDGSAAKYAAWKYFKEQAEYIPINYNETELAFNQLKLNKLTEIYIVDFCITFQEYMQLKSKCKKVKIIDHHRDANYSFVTNIYLEFLNRLIPWFKITKKYSILLSIFRFLAKPNTKLFNSICKFLDIDIPKFNTNKSGALLTWEYFHPVKPVPDIIRFISDRDLWRFKYPNTKAAIEGLKQSGDIHDMDYWDRLVYDKEVLSDCINNGNVIIQYNKANHEKFITSHNTFKIIKMHGLKAAIYNNTGSVNELAEEFYLDKNLDIDFVISYYIKGDGCIKLSLRSQNPKGTDVKLIANMFGGSGHYHSSGANLDKDQSIKFLQMVQNG